MKFLKKLGGYMPILSTVLVVACVGTSLRGYAAPVYEVEQPKIVQAAETTAKEKNRKQKRQHRRKETLIWMTAFIRAVVQALQVRFLFLWKSKIKVSLLLTFSAHRTMKHSLTERRVLLIRLLQDRHWM